MHVHVHTYTYIPDLKAAASLFFESSDPINWSKQPLSHVISAATGCKIW